MYKLNDDDGFKITGDWTHQLTQLKKEFPVLTNADLHLETGNENDLLRRMQTRLGKSRQEVIDIIRHYSSLDPVRVSGR